jgi:hypothetical protein
MCFESTQLACLLCEKFVSVPHAKFARLWLTRRTALTARRYYSTTKHLNLLPTHPEKHGPISVHFDLLEQLKEEQFPSGPSKAQNRGQNLSLLRILHDDEETSQAVGGGTREN